MSVFKFPNESFSGVDMVATAHMRNLDPNNKDENIVVQLGSIQTISYSINMDRKPIRSIGNVNVKDYVLGPRTIAGSLIFAVFNKHFAYKIIEHINSSINPSYAFLVDELPPFDITISAANEYGYQTRLVIYGIRLVNEGQVMSVNDIYTENTYQFVATDIEYLTDQKGYASYNGPGYTFEIQKEKQEIPEDKNNIEKIKDNMNGENTNTKLTFVSLGVKTIPGIKNGSKGIAAFNLTPTQSSGSIQITSNKLSNPIIVNVSNFPNSTVYVNLDEGLYNAVYVDNVHKKKSNTVQFTITEFIYTKPKKGIAPLIEEVTDTRIAIYSNLSDHAQVKYAKIIDGKQSDYEFIPLNGRRAIINNLIADTEYVIATCDTLNQYESSQARVKTLVSADKPFNDLKQFVFVNAEQFKYGEVIEYHSIIDEAKIIKESTLSIYNSITDAIVIIKNNEHSKMASMKVEDFKNIEEYNKAAEASIKKANRCYELIMASSKVTNDRRYAINRLLFALTPPVPEVLDNMSSVILTDKSTKALEFYRQVKHVSQFSSKVTSNYFTDHESGKKSCKFLGRPGWKHYVYAMNELNQRSPRLEFYVMTDEEKTRRTKELADETSLIDEAIAYSESLVGEEMHSLNLPDEHSKRILVKEVKDISLPLLPTPVVIESTNSKIILDVNYKDIIGQYEDKYFVALSEVNSALFSIPRYKVIINNNSDKVEFNADDHGLKPNTSYVVWIENDQGVQVSNCATMYTYDEAIDVDTIEESKIHYYELDKFISKFKKILSTKIKLDYEINYAIDNLKDDSSVNEKNFHERLIKNILSIKPRLSNEGYIIKSILESRHDINFVISEYFFNEDIKYENKVVQYPTKPEEYMVVVYLINIINEEPIIEVKTYKSIENKTLDIDVSNSIYAATYAIDRNIFSKSGILFVDTLSNLASKYKIDMEENM